MSKRVGETRVEHSRSGKEFRYVYIPAAEYIEWTGNIEVHQPVKDRLEDRGEAAEE